MDEQTRKIVVGVGIAAAIVFFLYSCGEKKDYYCVQWEGPTCIEYGTDY